MDEKLIIKKYLKPLANSKDSMQLQDDVASINVADEKYIVSNQDSLVMGTHFFESDNPTYIAKKSLRVNLSDLISKGVTPYGYFLSLALDDTIDENWIKLFSQGLAEDQKKYKITLLGGDTVSAPHGLFITINMLSKTNDNIVKRGGACYGCLFYTSGAADEGLGVDLGGRRIIKKKVPG